MGNVVHDGPFVVERGPRTTARCHFEDDATERPDVDGAGASRVFAFDNFGGHVHGCAGHGFVGLGDGVANERLALAGDDFGGAEVDVFDYTTMIEENV